MDDYEDGFDLDIDEDSEDFDDLPDAEEKRNYDDERSDEFDANKIDTFDEMPYYELIKNKMD